MEGGGAYNRNATMQGEVFVRTRHYLGSTIESMLSVNGARRAITIGDLGASQGLNSMSMIDFILKKFEEKSDSPLEFLVYHEDQPSNDFVTLLETLHSDSSYLNGRDNVFSAVISKSFYERLFPSQSVDFFVSYISLHWISKAPTVFKFPRVCHLQKGLISLEEEDFSANKIWKEHAHNDLVRFLEFRAEELVDNGAICITMAGHPKQPLSTPTLCSDAISFALKSKLISLEEAHSAVIPVYYRSIEEIRDAVACVPELHLECIVEVPVVYHPESPNQIADFCLAVFKPSLMNCVQRSFDESSDEFHIRRDNVSTSITEYIRSAVAKSAPDHDFPIHYTYLSCTRIRRS